MELLCNFIVLIYVTLIYIRIISCQFCKYVLLFTEMAGRSLLSRDLEKAHRAAKLEASPNSLPTLVTRGANQNWQIHPGWVQRYVGFIWYIQFEVLAHTNWILI